ncbi:MAG TPA: CDP-alcohol phosphatidyltransferase family protein [Clostridia bacterium]|nr:CDP-alcohol phosphatidyltransferase family protein [Clostridia bacterium]
MRHIPNILSGIRILLVPVFVYLFMVGEYLSAMAVYVIAFITDVVDGQLARHFHWTSAIGKLLDPLADKMMQIAALVCLCIARADKVIYIVLVSVCAIKEILMVIGGLIMLKRKVVACSDWIGKIATGLFALGIVLSMLSFIIPAVEPYGLGVLIVAACLSCIALAHYATTQFAPR